MPLKLIPPRQGKSPNWAIRGTYLGCYVDRSTGTSQKSLAEKLLRQIKRDVESGAVQREKGRGFAAAAASYMRAGGDNRFLAPLIKHFANMPLEEIDQGALDDAAALIYPEATAATRNRQVYTPIVAVLRRAGVKPSIERPIGWQSPKGVAWLRPGQAFAVFAAADERDAEFGLFLRFLCYTGMRLSEATERLTIAQVDLAGATVYIPRTKNEQPRRVHLTPELVLALANHPRGLNRPAGELVFRFQGGGQHGRWLHAALDAAGVKLEHRQRGFHLFRHTWATWMRRFGGLDTSGLIETGAWRDRASASRYEHLDATEEAQKADLLPIANGDRSTKRRSV